MNGIREAWLSPQVMSFLESASEEEQDLFFKQLRRIQRAPIANSEMISVPGQPFVWRCFRFGECLAIFNPHLEDKPIYVLECVRITP